MKLILTYSGHGEDGRHLQATVPFEAESIEAARAVFAAVAQAAFEARRLKFALWGQVFHVHNFYRAMAPAQVAHLQRVCGIKTLPPPTIVESDGVPYRVIIRPRIEQLETWFDRTRAENLKEVEDWVPA